MKDEGIKLILNVFGIVLGAFLALLVFKFLL